MRTSLVLGLVTALSLATTSITLATPIIMQGQFIRTAVSDDGTLGYGSGTSPGLLHDITGSSDFSLNDDYITPGTPHEGFSLSFGDATFVNDNSSGDSLGAGTLTDLSGTDFDHHVRYFDSNGFFEITHDIMFNNGDEHILIETEIMALQLLNNVQFARGIDPDPDVNRFGSFATENRYGLDRTNDGDFDDLNEIAQNDGVFATGLNSDQTIGLIHLDGGESHAAAIMDACCIQYAPNTYFTSRRPIVPGISSTADHGLGLAYNLGTLTAGTSAHLQYAYVLGDTLETVDTSGPSPTPEPGTWMLFGTGFMGMIGYSWRRREHST